MYCKHCGKQIADDSNYCLICGKPINSVDMKLSKLSDIPVVEVQLNNKKKSVFESTAYMQWRKPYVVRCVQMFFMFLFMFFFIWGIVWCIKGGNIDRALPSDMTCNFSFYSEVWEPLLITINIDLEEYDREHQLGYKEQWEKTCYQYEKWWESAKEDDIYKIDYHPNAKPLNAYWSNEFIHFKKITDDIAVRKYKKKVLSVYIIPSVFLMVIVLVWLFITPFPKSKDGLPRDIADEIEKYTYWGFVIPSYAFYRKGEKYGIVNVSKYKLATPPIYDSILWRQKNKSFDAELNGEQKKDLQIEKIISQYNQMTI